jgi:hypothetical protein
MMITDAMFPFTDKQLENAKTGEQMNLRLCTFPEDDYLHYGGVALLVLRGVNDASSDYKEYWVQTTTDPDKFPDPDKFFGNEMPVIHIKNKYCRKLCTCI